MYGDNALGLGLIAGILVVSLIVSTAMIFVPQLKSRLMLMSKAIWYFFTHRDITPFLVDLNDALTHGLVALKGRPSALTLLLGLMVGE